jgi:hypothetical protein
MVLESTETRAHVSTQKTESHHAIASCNHAEHSVVEVVSGGEACVVVRLFTEGFRDPVQGVVLSESAPAELLQGLHFLPQCCQII